MHYKNFLILIETFHGLHPSLKSLLKRIGHSLFTKMLNINANSERNMHPVLLFQGIPNSLIGSYNNVITCTHELSRMWKQTQYHNMWNTGKNMHNISITTIKLVMRPAKDVDVISNWFLKIILRIRTEPNWLEVVPTSRHQ